MTDDQAPVSDDRKFLHDLATPLAIVKTLTKRMHKEMVGEIDASPSDVQLKRLEKIHEAIAKMESLHADQKSRLSARRTA